MEQRFELIWRQATPKPLVRLDKLRNLGSRMEKVVFHFETTFGRSCSNIYVYKYEVYERWCNEAQKSGKCAQNLASPSRNDIKRISAVFESPGKRDAFPDSDQESIVESIYSATSRATIETNTEASTIRTCFSAADELAKLAELHRRIDRQFSQTAVLLHRILQRSKHQQLQIQDISLKITVLSIRADQLAREFGRRRTTPINWTVVILTVLLFLIPC